MSVDKSKFIDDMMPVSLEEAFHSNIKPLITITQAAHESGWGASELTKQANNLFGFTGESWEVAGRPIIKLPTKEFVKGGWVTMLRPFRAYASWNESVRDWSNLMRFPRYKLALIAATKGDIKEFAKQIAAGGYATDPNYAHALIGVSKEVLAIKPDLGQDLSLDNSTGGV